MLQKKKSFRMTRQRKMILKELRKVKTHPSADEVYEMVRKKLPRISLGTVYRNLEILSQQGEIQRLELGCSLKRFDGNPENHYHIRCVRCSRVEDIMIAPLKNVENEIAGSTDFQVTGHQIEFLGLCRDCLQKERSAFPEQARAMS